MPDPAYAMDTGEYKLPVDILIVDDTPAKLLALESALTPLGENLVRARSGREALRHLLSRDFATVILDVNMPDLDGFETARMIRSRQRSAGTPIIFISAVNMEEADTHRGYALGAVDYICAPFDAEMMRAKVAVFVELHRKSEEARLQARRLEERSRELESSQRELRMSERMASLGTLCAGLGHDMGNLLLPVSVWVDTVKPEELPGEWRDGVENLRSCVQYLRKLASGLRLLSLDPSRNVGDEQTMLEKWADEVGPVLRNALPRGVSLEIDIPEGLPPVGIEPHRLAQVAFNLVQNAGEVLRESTGGNVRLWAKPGDASVRIGVTDDGPGMSKEVLERCLDPFFTTKTRGISTGLGLSLVHSITRACGARLEVDSAAGHGTTFAFTLPVVSRAAMPVVLTVISIHDPRKRAVASALVRAAGCQTVSEATDAHSGPAIWITDGVDGLVEQATAFHGESEYRRVFLLDGKSCDSGLIQVTTLTGENGLAVSLRRFIEEVGRAMAPVPA